jgi:hypothetical protein
MRFFRLEVSEVKAPRDVELRLSEAGAPSDEAWLVSLAIRGGVPSARRPERSATPITGLGREASALWVALFNRSAEVAKRFELTLGLRKRAAAGAGFRKPTAR